MKKRINKIRLIIVSSILAFSSCGIFSLHPLYYKKDLIIKPEIVGTWKKKGDINSYIMIDTVDQNFQFTRISNNDTIGFAMGLLMLNDQYFIDILPTSISGLDMFDLMRNNFIPTHTFMKIDFTEDQILITEFDNDRLETLFKENKIRLAHEFPWKTDKYSGEVVITASTNELQKFIARYANEANAFKTPIKYERF